MKRGIKIFFFSLVSFVSCVSLQQVEAKKEENKISEDFTTVKAKKKRSNTIEFNFLQLNDVYEIAPIQGGKYGGMARVATVHKQLLKENPNTMMVLAGDFLNPSLLGTVKHEGNRLRGRQMVDVMNHMGFDLVAFGNHEFDLSYKDLQKRLNESNFEWISGNIKHYKAGKKELFSKILKGKKFPVKDTFIREFVNIDGTRVKIGFISVCIPSNPRSYIAYGDVIEEAKRSYNELKGKVDLVFGLTHVKINQDKEIAKLLPNIPLIMGGHEHTNSYDKEGKVIIAKADANAKTVYIHKVSYNKLTKEVDVYSELKEINKEIQPDKKIAEIVNKWQAILKNKIKELVANPEEVIYNAIIPLDARDTPIRSKQTNMGKLIAKAMSFAFDDSVDCALVNGGSIRLDDTLTGNITPIDIFKVLPYGGAILKIELKGSLLKKVLDFGAESVGTGAYLQRYNVDNNKGRWFVQNELIDKNKVYKVAISDYLLKGFDIPFLSEKNKEILRVYQPKLGEKGHDIRSAIIQYFKK
ncbi:Putative 5'-nucleotidase [Tenacibaculum maritimum]|uniref:bifunctional metallophosphatase/5'-nucleotidase n=1 Tax=Tenacibaculum maritimum TaxID=107401 RepID=UPI0012E5834D|nr:bifunctional metallophosphatase/5'-nucleotidase [Tenacibaculum maritimum]CAA0255353.1 Putative 5'-nucleotidase [Tenacibaculum maritimum]